jgi:hypothetical protein
MQPGPAADERVMARSVAIVLALVPLAATGFQALLVLALMNYCEDSCDGTYWQLHTGRAVLLTTVLVALFAITSAFFVFVARGRSGHATTCFVLQAVLGLGVFAIWVHGSKHSDGRLITVGGLVETCAVLAVVISRAESRASRQAAR